MAADQGARAALRAERAIRSATPAHSARTTAVGQALGRGAWKHTEVDVSAVKRC